MMKFKDKVTFLKYVTSNENYGPIKVQFHGSIELSISTIKSSKSIPVNIDDALYDIIWYSFFDTTDLLGHSNHNNSYSEFTLQNQNGELAMVDSYYNFSHQDDKDEMIEQIKEVLNNVLNREYMLTIHFNRKYVSGKEIKLKEYYLAYYDDEKIEKEIEDHSGMIKSSLINTLTNWAKDYSDELSKGEYDFDEFELDFSISSYPNMDTWCNFYEESKRELIDLSVLEINSNEIVIS